MSPGALPQDPAATPGRHGRHRDRPGVTSEPSFRRLWLANALDEAGKPVAAKTATELVKDLSRVANQARQAQITQEITEIVGGAGVMQLPQGRLTSAGLLATLPTVVVNQLVVGNAEEPGPEAATASASATTRCMSFMTPPQYLAQSCPKPRVE